MVYKGSDYDNEISIKFKNLLKKEETKKSNIQWSKNVNSFLAYIILMDQFSRQIYRNNPKSFENDKRILTFVKKHYNKYLNKMDAVQKMFALMPFQHSEKIVNQKKKIDFLKKLIENENNEKEKKILETALFHQ